MAPRYAALREHELPELVRPRAEGPGAGQEIRIIQGIWPLTNSEMLLYTTIMMLIIISNNGELTALRRVAIAGGNGQRKISEQRVGKREI